MTLVTNLEITMDQFLEESGFRSPSAIKRVKAALTCSGYAIPRQLLLTSKRDLEDIDGISDTSAKILFKQLIRLKGGNLLSADKIRQEYNYLETNIHHLNQELSNGYMMPSTEAAGIRSGSVIELVGPPAIGKSKFCQSLALQMMKFKKDGGWNKQVIYFTSSYEPILPNIVAMNEYHQLNGSQIDKNLIGCYASSLDELYANLKSIPDPSKVGLIIIDNLSEIIANNYSSSHQIMGYAADHYSSRGYRDQVLHDIFNLLKQQGHYFGTVSIAVNRLERDHESRFMGSENYIPKLEYSIRYHCHIAFHMSKANMNEYREMEGRYRDLPDRRKLDREHLGHPIRITCMKSNLHSKFRVFGLVTKYGVLGAPEYVVMLSGNGKKQTNSSTQIIKREKDIKQKNTTN
ncbi:MAG: hypothetical protein HeimC2_21710 [Candidatus Heimdallarchaeota archaeon LC_2]|nr:MAG: hypothetical protein HeimC2_21710 [Candidatus Heimdallarchaeota archaeon LC_2]